MDFYNLVLVVLATSSSAMWWMNRQSLKEVWLHLDMLAYQVGYIKGVHKIADITTPKLFDQVYEKMGREYIHIADFLKECKKTDAKLIDFEIKLNELMAKD